MLLFPLLALAQEPPPGERGAPGDRSFAVRLDLYGDPLPPGAIARLGTLRLREPAGLGAVAFSPGLRAVASSSGSRIRVWDAATGKAMKTIEHGGAPIESLAFASDGRILASGDRHGGILLWDLESGGEPRQVASPHLAAAEREADSSAVTQLAFSPDGRSIASANDGRDTIIWDVPSAAKKFTLPGSGSSPGRPVFSPDGKTLAFARMNGILLYDPGTGERIREIRGHPVDPDDASGAGEDDSSGGDRATGSIAFSPDGRSIASAGAMDGSDGTVVHLWDAASGKETREFETDGDDLHCVSFSRDGGRIAAAGGRFLHVWDAATGEQLLESPAYRVSGMALSPDGKTVGIASRRTSTIRFVDVATGKRMPEMTAHEDRLSLVVFSPDGASVASLDGGGSVIVWASASGKPLFTIEPVDARLAGLTFGAEGRTLLTNHADGTFRRRDAATGDLISESNPFVEEGRRSRPREGRRPEDESDDPLTFFIFARDQETTAAGMASGVIIIRKRGVQGPAARLAGHEGRVEYMMFGDRGERLLSWGVDGTARVWELRTGKELWKIEPHAETITTLGFTPGFERVAMGESTGKIHVWDMTEGREVLEREAHEGGVRSIFFSPGGDRVISMGEMPSFEPGEPDRRPPANKPHCHVWDIPTGVSLLTLDFEAATGPPPEDEGMASAVVISPDGRYLASGGRDHEVYLWEIASGSPALILRGHRGDVVDLAMGPGGRMLASAAGDRTVLVWSLDPRGTEDGESPTEPGDLGDLWANLAAGDARKAYEAIWRLAAAGSRAVGYIEEHLVMPETDPGERLRSIRCAEVLERVGTPEAQAILESLARGAPRDLPAREAKAALERLAARRQPK